MKPGAYLWQRVSRMKASGRLGCGQAMGTEGRAIPETTRRWRCMPRRCVLHIMSGHANPTFESGQ
eukprot:2675174-Rhodomonas_salina.1